MNKIRIAAVIMSIGIHAGLVGAFNGHRFAGNLVPVLPVQKKDEVSLEFVEVPETQEESKVKKDTKVISDKTVEAKDRLKDKIKDSKSRAKEVDKGKQIPKRSSEAVRPVMPQPVPQPEPKLPDMMGPSPEKQEVVPQIPVKQTPRVEFDVINIPEITDSIFSAPEEGPLSFEAQAHKIGPYFKKIKRDIERYWISYLIFKYQNTAPQESEVAVKFKILKNGDVQGVTVLEYSGDPLFRDFSVASIVNTAPFPPLPENLKEDIEKEGGLDIVFTFKYR